MAKNIPATPEDVNLIIKLYELRREEKLRKARDWFGTFQASNLKDFMEKYPQGSQESLYFRMVTSYWDMVAGFLNSGAVNEELFFQSGLEMLFCWERIRGLVTEMREMFKMPLMYQNLEQASQRAIEYLKKTSPGSYEAMVQMLPR